MTDTSGMSGTRRRWSRPTWLQNRMAAGLVMVLGFVVLLWLLLALALRLFLPDAPAPIPFPAY